MSATLDLQLSHVAIVRRILSAHLPEVEVWAYGSRVTAGTSHDGSDLDLVLRHPEQQPVGQPKLGRLKTALEESDLPILVDVLDWAYLPEAFRREIERAYVIMHAPGADDALPAPPRSRAR